MNQNNVDDQPRSAQEQLKLEAALTTLFEQQITFNAVLGVKVSAFESDEIVTEQQMRPELVGHFQHNRLHGGVISSILDATGGLAVMWAMAQRQKSLPADDVLQLFAPLGTIDLRVDFVRPGIGELFTARARVVRLGKRIASTQMTLHNESDKLVSTGTAAYIVS